MPGPNRHKSSLKSPQTGTARLEEAVAAYRAARATRSMWDGLQIIKAVIDAGASIKVLDRS
jgi:hypothetical protein